MRRQRSKVFLDTSALIAGIASVKGAARAVLQLAETGLIEIIVSRQVIVEADRNIEDKLPEMLGEYRKFIELLAPVLVDDPSFVEIKRFLTVINSDDAPILAAAVNADADFLITWDKKHFIGKNIHVHSNMKIVTPGEFLKYFRESL
ncbi:MAG TPA: putative toxin-antitoxin system toxin component, PIN family [Nitrospiraceae bacterium]|nr:putative toxin-antitoxin system toxin component, PIN family [Nitrospiraceae bacterium]